MMSRSIFVAVAGLVALTAVRGITIKMEGASTMTKLINGPEFKAAAKPTIVTYGGNGSGAGKTWVTNGNTNGQVMGFGDGTFVPLPANVGEVPVAYGSQAIYVNLPGLPAGACLNNINQCRLFNANARAGIKIWSDLLTGLPAALASRPVRIVVRSDSSGSTSVVKTYMALLCARYGPFTFAVNTATSPPTVLPGYVGGDTTSGVLAQIISTPGSVGYMGCGQTRMANLIELPMANQLGVCTLCRNCVQVPTTAAPLPGYSGNIKCGNYALFKVATPTKACDWTGIQVNGDKDNDGDIYGVDNDNDQDGINTNDYPLVVAIYSYFNKVNATPTCAAAKKILKKMISVAFQKVYPGYGFQPLPLNVRRTGCICIKALCPGVASTGNGILTTAGDCL